MTGAPDVVVWSSLLSAVGAGILLELLVMIFGYCKRMVDVVGNLEFSVANKTNVFRRGFMISCNFCPSTNARHFSISEVHAHTLSVTFYRRSWKVLLRFYLK